MVVKWEPHAFRWGQPLAGTGLPMTDEQTLVLNFLKCSPESWFSKKEIARRAVKRKVFEENPNWATQPISDLLVTSVIEEDKNGLVRMKGRQKAD